MPNLERQRLARLVFETVLGLYLDLPSLNPARPSLNAAILSHTVEHIEFYRLFFPKETAALDRNAYHLLALLNVPLFDYVDIIKYYCNVRPASATRSPDDETDWFGVGVHVRLANLLTLSSDYGSEEPDWAFVDPDIAQHTFKDIFEPLRGTGLLGLRPPANLGPDDVFDWPGIRGRWHHHRCDKEHVKLAVADEEGSPRLFQQTTFDLVPVPDRGALCTAYKAGTGLDEALVIPFAHPDPPRGLPPVYFYGWSGAASDPSRPVEFLFGVAGLTADNPPQIRWDWATIRLGPEQIKSVFQGVHVGGRGAKKGVFGAWKRILPIEPSVQATSSCEQQQVVTFRGITDGTAWFVKDVWTTTSGKDQAHAE